MASMRHAIVRFVTAAAKRLEHAIELSELAEEMLRMKLQRAHPEASNAEIEALIDAWYLERPGAEHGDSPGRPTVLPRRS